MKTTSVNPFSMENNQKGQGASHQSIKTSLENLLNKMPDGKKGTLGDLVSDKARSLKSTVKELLEEIDLRKNLDYAMLKKIDDTICKEDTVLMNLEKPEGQYEFDKRIELKKLEKKHDDSVLDLEKEKRKEYLECWRDLMSLKKYLMSAFREYWDFAKKRDILKT